MHDCPAWPQLPQLTALLEAGHLSLRTSSFGEQSLMCYLIPVHIMARLCRECAKLVRNLGAGWEDLFEPAVCARPGNRLDHICVR